ncbi:hypothetical protein RJ639_041708 [Escallonia herrerae]|uniref:Zinc knuckle CX2CX4HX4C domain-containing protein n=1 Tax=Escallonia herrerae TaxID=1293975 RepID=A0AA88WI78_9ASTE|nr:hypothetical protein RJ639_041708 [Escallonia herrerae]
MFYNDHSIDSGLLFDHVYGLPEKPRSMRFVALISPRKPPLDEEATGFPPNFPPRWSKPFYKNPGTPLKNAEKIGSKIGKVLEVDFTADGNLAWLRFLRIQVQIDITKPLHTGFNRIKDNRQKMWIRLQYERLPNFCFSYGRLGHTDRNCPHKPPIPTETMASPYGPWLRADNSDECPHSACWSPAPVSTQTPEIPSMKANSVSLCSRRACRHQT